MFTTSEAGIVFLLSPYCFPLLYVDHNQEQRQSQQPLLRQECAMVLVTVLFSWVLALMHFVLILRVHHIKVSLGRNEKNQSDWGFHGTGIHFVRFSIFLYISFISMEFSNFTIFFNPLICQFNWAMPMLMRVCLVSQMETSTKTDPKPVLLN